MAWEADQVKSNAKAQRALGDLDLFARIPSKAQDDDNSMDVGSMALCWRALRGIFTLCTSEVQCL